MKRDLNSNLVEKYSEKKGKVSVNELAQAWTKLVYIYFIWILIYILYILNTILYAVLDNDVLYIVCHCD